MRKGTENIPNQPTTENQFNKDLKEAVTWLTHLKKYHPIPDDLVERISEYALSKRQDE